MLILGWLCGFVLWLYLREIEVKKRWAWLVYMDEWLWPMFVTQWGVLMQAKNRYRMTPGVRHSGIVNWLIYLFIYLSIFVHISAKGRWKNLNTLGLFVFHKNAPLQFWANRLSSFWISKANLTNWQKIQIFSPNGATGSQLSPNRSK